MKYSKQIKIWAGVVSLLALVCIILGSSSLWTMPQSLEIFLYVVLVPGFVLWYFTPGMLAEEYAAESKAKPKAEFSDTRDVG